VQPAANVNTNVYADVQHRAFWLNTQTDCAAPAREPSQPPVLVTASRHPAQETIKIHNVPAHDAVATALSHKHHPIIHVGAGPLNL